VVNLLQQHGVDTRGLEAEDLSISEDATSVLHAQELVSAVAQLVTLTRDAQAKLLAAANHRGDTLDATVEQLRSQAETAAEEFQALVADCDDLRAKVSELQELLELADRRVSSSEDNVSSEVQALEEENIELMRENRELRKDLATVKAQAQSQVNRPQAPKSHGKENQTMACLNVEALSSGAPGSEKKRLFGSEVCKPSPAVGPVVSAGEQEGSKAKKTLKKAKPLVSTTGTEAMDAAGECAQS
jgi:chromosome segregation ATPase